MLGVTNPGTLVVLVLYSLAVTLVTNWIVAWFQRPALPGRVTVATVVSLLGSLLWMALMFVAGVIAVRYIERIDQALAGYVLFGALTLLFSLERALLYQRIDEDQIPGFLRNAAHLILYPLAGSVVYLLLSWIARQPAQPLLFIPVWIGAWLPDLDSPDSIPGRLLPIVSRRLEARLGSFQQWHSLAGALVVCLSSSPLILLIGWRAFALLPLGFCVHLFVDLLRPEGVMLLWPLTDRRLHILGIIPRRGLAERVLLAILAIVAVFLLTVVEVGRPVPPPAPSYSYEQNVARYYAQRGRNLVFVWVEGSWQTTGQRVSGTFEVLNASGESLTLLDRYDGRVFSAGRQPEDNLYVSSMRLSTGPAVRVKPVEIHIENGALGKALPTIYHMEREPGLLHIYVSGDIVLYDEGRSISTSLDADYAQTRLRKVQSEEPGHYKLHYLTASELIALANLQVETADLVIVATYEVAASGPTVTPLPPLPPTMEATE